MYLTEFVTGRLISFKYQTMHGSQVSYNKKDNRQFLFNRENLENKMLDRWFSLKLTQLINELHYISFLFVALTSM